MLFITNGHIDVFLGERLWLYIMPTCVACNKKIVLKGNVTFLIVLCTHKLFKKPQSFSCMYFVLICVCLPLFDSMPLSLFVMACLHAVISVYVLNLYTKLLVLEAHCNKVVNWDSRTLIHFIHKRTRKCPVGWCFCPFSRVNRTSMSGSYSEFTAC